MNDHHTATLAHYQGLVDQLAAEDAALEKYRKESSVEQQYKEFAKWCRENPHLGLDPRLHTHAGRIEDGGYISHGRTSTAFKAWQASRQATEE